MHGSKHEEQQGLSVNVKPKDRVQSREQPTLETAHVGQANDKLAYHIITWT